jgi:hypothetical protein
MKFSIHTIGEELNKVIVIDDAVPAAQGLITMAAQSGSFLDVTRNSYPGLRRSLDPNSEVERDYVNYLCHLAGPVMHDVFGIKRFTVDAASLSLMTKRPLEANPLTRIPHYDELKKPKYALLHFLTLRSQGGTGFYRHRRTGFERISLERKDMFHEGLRQDWAAYGDPEMAYISGSNEAYEQIGYFEGRFNRLLIYSGALLHSAHVPADFDYSADPRRGRLTSNLFLTVTPEKS